MPNSHENYLARLYSAAEVYRNQGWSVIPVRGDSDPSNPKAPAVEWSRFQHRLPADAELKNWFKTEKFAGLAIVCGPVSSLAVLDFDDADCAQAFVQTCPDLTATLMVSSGGRGLPHYYYRVPSHVQISTKRTPQADLQAAGTYVVAPPTVAAGHAWEVVQDIEPYTLSQQDADRIRVFLETWAYQAEKHRTPTETLPQPVDPVPLSPETLYRFYRRQAVQMGRNEALFRASSLARDSGWSQPQVISLLLDFHITQAPNSHHPPETPVQRRREGVRTIASAFRYQARPRPVLTLRRGLSNAIREALLKLQQVSVARVLDGLLLAGIEAGARFTERMACQVLRVFGIGRRTVMAALQALTPDHKRIFQKELAPQNPPERLADAAKQAGTEETKCFFVSGANRVKSPKTGRAPAIYRMPDHSQLCRLLHVRPSGSDPLTPADLRSPDSYRRALQRALLLRRPGQYSRQWLAARLGISVWTCRRYDAQIGLLVQPMYEERRVTWASLDSLPLEDDPAPPSGLFLETPEGKRYPPLRGLARRLLARNIRLTLRRQGWNYYRLASAPAPALALAELPAISQPAAPAPEEPICEEFHKTTEMRTDVLNQPAEPAPPEQTPAPPEFWLCPHCLKFHVQPERPASCEKCQHDDWQCIPQAIWQDVERCKQWWQSLWKQHQRQQRRAHRPARSTQPQPAEQSAPDALAARVYEQVRQRTPRHALTRAAAHQLVRQYGQAAVESALDLLRERGYVANAAGFLITVLRGAHPGSAAASQRTLSEDDHAAWVDQLRQSPYAHLVANDIGAAPAAESD